MACSRSLIACLLVLLTAACADSSHAPDRHNLAYIPIPAATSIEAEKSAQHTALTRAAQTTLKRGFDSFIADDEQIIKGAGSAMTGGGAGGIGNGGYSSVTHPRSILTIHMFHTGEPEAASATDARAALAANGAY